MATPHQMAFYRMVAHAAPPRMVPCTRQVHGRQCAVPWGWDPDHSDQLHPYTLEQLARRSHTPHRFAYPDADAYASGFHLWRALRRDGDPTPAERDAALRVTAMHRIGYVPEWLAQQ